ncbi:MAG: protein translocase subunit SecF [Gemmatimonadetes bacterium]|nr:protein translocase subunit SecF [Gemmatimonadota bacterium]
MLRIFHNTTYDFIRWWRTAAALTIAFIVIGLGSFAVTGGVNWSIEFTGGTLIQLKFAKPADAAEIRAVVDGAGIGGAEIQQFGSNTEFTVRARGENAADARTGVAGGAVREGVERALKAKYGDGVKVVRSGSVGPKVGAELSRGAFIAMLLGSLITLVYLAIRFEWRFGLAAVLSTAHDILVTLAFIKLFHFEVSLTVVAAILTLLGYSMNDTIIIFDRVRENVKKGRKSNFYDLLNESVNETLPRSILTHTTTLAATLALLIFAGEVIRPFAWVMFFGIFIATFSSIYVASPLLMWIENKWPRTDGAGRPTTQASRNPAASGAQRPSRQPAGAGR